MFPPRLLLPLPSTCFKAELDRTIYCLFINVESSNMYEKGDILYLTSDTICSTDITNFTPAGTHAALRLPQRTGIVFGAHQDNRTSSAPANLIYQMVIRDVYTPYTMAVVCRVRLLAVFDSPTDIARHVPLPSAPDLDEEAFSDPCSESEVSDENASPQEPDFILKLYDRRCYMNVRNELNGGEPYDEGKARAYQEHRQVLPAPRYCRLFWDMQGYDREDESEKMVGLFEAWLEGNARHTWQTEVNVYNVLRDLQGKSIPKLYDTVSCYTKFDFTDKRGSPGQAGQVSSGAETRPVDCGETLGHPECNHAVVDWNRVQGILIEFVPSVSLKTFVHTALRSGSGLRKDLVAHVASIADEAVGVILQIDKYPVLNPDVRLENILVRQSFISTLNMEDKKDGKADKGLVSVGALQHPRQIHTLTRQDSNLDTSSPDVTRCVAIDFGHARMRSPLESDEQWRCAKLMEDEEGRLALDLCWEIGTIVKELRADGHGQPRTEDPQVLGQSVWKCKRRNEWRRGGLSPEEEEEYMCQGLHPDHWKF